MIYPWQKVKKKEVKQHSNPGKQMQPIYEVERDKLTNQPRLKVKETYDQQEYIDSFGEQADPVTLMQRVKIGEIKPWNGENCFDMSQLPETPIEMAQYIAMKTNMSTENMIRSIEKRQAEMVEQQEKQKKQEQQEMKGDNE